METAFALLAGAFVATAVFLLLSRSLLRTLLGVAVLGNGINLVILVAGRLAHGIPPILPPGEHGPAEAIANPLPQALILTAIVIGFAFFAFLLVLAYRTAEALGSDETDAMRVAEPASSREPLGY